MKFIFEVKIKPNHTAEEYIAAWKKASEIIQRQPGAQGTSLYEKTDDENALIAIATWESKEARDSAIEKLKRVEPKTRDILDAHSKIGDIKIVGNFREPEWHVLPPS